MRFHLKHQVNARISVLYESVLFGKRFHYNQHPIESLKLSHQIQIIILILLKMNIQNEPLEFEERIFQDNTIQTILKTSQQVNENTQNLVFHSTIGNISHLTDHLILCSASSISLNIIDLLNVNCIVNAAPELPDTPLSNNDIIYHKISILDSGNSRILAHFDEAADLIHKIANSGGKVLVYCVAGVSRSASICLAYFMKYHQMSLLDAYNFVKTKRPKIRPNCGFFKQLIEYEETLFGSNSVKMVFNKVVQMEIPDVYDNEYQFIRKHRYTNGRY